MIIHEDADDVEEVTNELVVVVLQLLLGVPAIAVVHHLLLVDFWELEKARLLATSAQGILARICELSCCTFSIVFLASVCMNYFLWSIHLYFSQHQATYFCK